MQDAPQAFVVVDRKGNIVSTNIEAVLAWRRKHQPEVYKTAMEAAQQRTADGFAHFARYRLERGLVPQAGASTIIEPIGRDASPEEKAPA